MSTPLRTDKKAIRLSAGMPNGACAVAMRRTCKLPGDARRQEV